MALSREEVAEIYVAAEKLKMTHLAKAVINQDGYLDDDWVQTQCDHSGYAVLTNAYSILLETPPSVVQSIIRGDLPEIATDRNAEIHQLQRSSYVAVGVNLVCPSIYTVYLVDKTTSKPPTVADLYPIIRYVKQTYTNSATLALAQNLETRIDEYNQNPQIPLPGGLVDVGFSADGALRITQHLSNIGSNEVMQHFRAAAAHLFGQAKYGLRGFIVCKLRKFNQCGLAEVLFSRMAQSYTSRGGGFNGIVAGRSLTGGRNLPVVSWEEIAAADPTPIYTKNLADDMEKLDDLRNIAERWRNLAERRALQDIAISMLPVANQVMIRAAEAELRATLYRQRLVAASEQDDKQGTGEQDGSSEEQDVDQTADQDGNSPAESQIESVVSGDPRTPTRLAEDEYSSNIEDSGPIIRRPARGNQDDDDEVMEDSIESD